MKYALALVAAAGVAASANAQNTKVTMRVANLTQAVASTDTNVNANPGDTIEVRVYVSLEGGAGYALAGFNYEPGLMGWRAGDDTLGTIDNFNSNGGSAPNALDGAGNTGRHTPYNSAMIATAGNIVGFTTFSPNTIRIAGSKATGASLANLMVAAGSVHAPTSGIIAPAGTQNLHLFTFRFTAGGLIPADGGSRVLTANVFRNGFGTAAASQGVGRWWLNVADATANNFATVIDTATVTIVPTPGALALLGLGGLVAGRRRR